MEIETGFEPVPPATAGHPLQKERVDQLRHSILDTVIRESIPLVNHAAQGM